MPQPDVSASFAFFAGLLSFFTPCILPIVPSFLVFVGGVSSTRFFETNGPSHGLFFILHVVAFILGFSTLLVLLGYSASFFGTWIVQYRAYLVKVSGVLLLVFGLFYICPFLFPLLNKEKVLAINRRPETLAGSFLVGLSFFLGWTPCLSPTLSSILLVSSFGPPSRGMMLSALYASGLALPFLLSAIFLKKLLRRTRGFSSLSITIQRILGMLLMLVGLSLLLRGTIPAVPL